MSSFIPISLTPKRYWSFKKIRATAAWIAVLVALAGCGLKDDLVLPTPSEPESKALTQS